MKKYLVLSPDRFPIKSDSFTSIQEAVEYTQKWCRAYQHQGYYLTSGREKIPADELVHHLCLVPEDKLFAGRKHEVPMDAVIGQFDRHQPNSEKLVATARATAREQWEKEQIEAGKDSITPQSPAKAKDIEPEEPER